MNTHQKVLELDVKSPELTQKAEKYPLYCRRHTHYINADKHTRTHPELSSLTVSPRCITLSGMQGGGSPQQAQHNAQSQERLQCCVFATRDGGREIVCVMHLDLFWHAHNYAARLLQQRLNVASKVLRIQRKLRVSIGRGAIGGEDGTVCVQEVPIIFIDSWKMCPLKSFDVSII